MYWILMHDFSTSIERIVWFIPFLLLMWYITLIGLLVLNSPCISEIVPAWLCCVILFIYCWIWIMCSALLCSVTQSCPTLCNPTNCSHQVSLSMGFSRQEYSHRLLFPTPGLKPMSLASSVLAGRFFIILPPGKSIIWFTSVLLIVFCNCIH